MAGAQGAGVRLGFGRRGWGQFRGGGNSWGSAARETGEGLAPFFGARAARRMDGWRLERTPELRIWFPRSAAPRRPRRRRRRSCLPLSLSLSLSLYHTSHHSQSATDHTTVTQTCTGVQPPRVKRKKNGRRATRRELGRDVIRPEYMRIPSESGFVLAVLLHQTHV
jgi:hypothetical protein